MPRAASVGGGGRVDGSGGRWCQVRKAAGKSWLRLAGQTRVKRTSQHVGLLLDHIFKVNTPKTNVLVRRPGRLKQ